MEGFAGKGGSLLDFSKISVMVVEDNEHMRYLMRMVLRTLGITRIYEAANGEEAIAEMAVHAPDIVLTDWDMHPIDGLELTRFLRNSPESPNPFVPIIMVTAHSERQRVLEARDAGITEFLVKPISAKGVYSRLRAVVEQPRRFVRTRVYFGPDRRRKKDDPAYHGPDRRGTEEALPPLPAMDADLTQDQINRFYFTQDADDPAKSPQGAVDQQRAAAAAGTKPGGAGKANGPKVS